jgi:hypothetical protein
MKDFLHSWKLNLASARFRNKPIANKPSILPILFNEHGFVFDKANGTAIPMIKINDGNTKSAGLNPSQEGCFIHQAASGPLQSTTIIPNIVKPLTISKEFNLCF